MVGFISLTAIPCGLFNAKIWFIYLKENQLAKVMPQSKQIWTSIALSHSLSD